MTWRSSYEETEYNSRGLTAGGYCYGTNRVFAGLGSVL
jgi:hypothetical protein